MALYWFLAVVALVVGAALCVAFLGRFYRKAAGGFALIRTGLGGRKVVMDGGCLALPFLHRVEEINMSALRLAVSRGGERSLITADRLRVDAEMEFQLRVIPTVAGVGTAVQALGAKALRAEDLRGFFEGKFIDAMQAAAAERTMDELHEKRGVYAKVVADALRENAAQSGLQLESASLVRLDQTPFSALDQNNAFNAVGMRKLAEVISSNKEARARIEAESEAAIHRTELDAAKRQLLVEQEREEARARQELEIEKARSAAEAEKERARQSSRMESEQARIETDLKLKTAETDRDKNLRANEIAALLETETRKMDGQIALSAKRAEETAAQAKAEKSRAAILTAQEETRAAQEIAAAERVRKVAETTSAAESESSAAKSKRESDAQIAAARARLESGKLDAEEGKTRLLAEAEGRRALILAENERSPEAMRLRLETRKLEKLPEIAAQLVKPMEKVESIRINQISGLGGAGAGGGDKGGGKAGAAGAADALLDLALQMPAMKKLGEAVGMDLDASLQSAKGEDTPASSGAEGEKKKEKKP